MPVFVPLLFDPNARVPLEVMDSISAHVMDPMNKAKRQEPRPWYYWICKKQRGQLSEIMNDLTYIRILLLDNISKL